MNREQDTSNWMRAIKGITRLDRYKNTTIREEVNVQPISEQNI